MCYICPEKIVDKIIANKEHNFKVWNSTSVNYLCAAVQDININTHKYTNSKINAVKLVVTEYLKWNNENRPTYIESINEQLNVFKKFIGDKPSKCRYPINLMAGILMMFAIVLSVV